MTTPEHRAARRAVARRLHPDVGGDARAFDEALRAVDAAHGVPQPDGSPLGSAGSPRTDGAATVPPVLVVTTWRGRAGRVARVVRARTRPVTAEVRRRLPPSFPGSRRYGRL